MKVNALPFALVLVVGGAVAALAVQQVRLQRERDRFTASIGASRAHLAAAQQQLAAETTRASDLDRQLLALDAELGKTKIRLTATELRNVELTRAAAHSRDALAAAEQREHAAHEQIAALERTVAAAPAPTPPVAAAVSTLSQPVQTPAPVAPAAPPPPTALLTTSLRPGGSVVEIGPANSFVVLDYGLRHGASAGQSLTIRHGTVGVAQVLITDARPRFSIAHVRPDSLRGVLQKGDSAVLTD